MSPFCAIFLQLYVNIIKNVTLLWKITMKNLQGICDNKISTTGDKNKDITWKKSLE